eukprot:scaffold22583_cov106-Cylindrotheca_fusiformis.AAC.18
MSKKPCIFSYAFAAICLSRSIGVLSLSLPPAISQCTNIKGSVAIEEVAHSSATFASNDASPLDGKVLLASLNNSPSNQVSTKYFQQDQVVRILDGNTIKLQHNGIVSFAGARYPSAASASGNFQFPECFSYAPTYKLRQLIPAKTSVKVRVVGSKPSARQAIVIRTGDSLVVNEELIKSGFAKTKPITAPELQDFMDVKTLKTYEKEANRMGLGIFRRCDDDYHSARATFVAEFEPLDYDVETRWGNDGGKQVVVKQTTKGESSQVPENPGDVKGCSDFESYEDALRWYETYRPYYGDVAKL